MRGCGVNRFGEYLKRRRKEADLTQEDLARSLKVSNTYIHQLETGKIDAPTERRCRQLAAVLNVPPGDIWAMAKEERLKHFAERVGIEPPTDLDRSRRGEDALAMTPAERALIKLYRKLDEETRREFNGLIAMLFRHYPEEEVQANLRDYLRIA